MGLTAVSALLFGFSGVQAVVRDGNTLIVPTEHETIRLQVFSPSAVRVVAGLEIPKSFVVLKPPLKGGWTWKAQPGEVWLETSAVKVRVDLHSARVAFFDRSDKPILNESTDGRALGAGKAKQEFDLATGEAIYGLGQHQDGAMDRRGTSVLLRQENREVAVPMMVSTRGYGLLWDNASITRVNVGAGDEATIPAAQLIDDDSKPGALTGTYYEGKNFGANDLKPKLVRRDESIDFDWNTTPPPGLPHDHYCVRWSGAIQIDEPGRYRFAATSDDGARLYIDGQPVFEDFTARAIATVSGNVDLTRGRHEIRFEYFQEQFDAKVRLTWCPPSTKQSLIWSSEVGNSVDYTFFYGPDTDAVIAGYRDLTGQAPMFGRWAYGLWQSKERYQTQAELLGVAQEYRRRKIPLDGVIQDWQYWIPGQWGSQKFDPSRYPDPKAMVDGLHALDTHVLISVWPKFDTGLDTATEMDKAGFLFKPVYPNVFPAGTARWYDPYGKPARDLYWKQINDRMGSFGLDGWWLDASEPELGGNWGEMGTLTTAMGPGAKVYNAFPLFHTQGVYEGQRAANKDKRSFILTRSGYAGQQRNGAVTWSGDINGNWDVYRAQIPAGLNFSMSGIPYWNTDTGGFFTPALTPDYQELFVRWFQFSTFCPMLRIHGTGPAKEIWRFTPQNQRVLQDYDRLRYRLLPYIYSTSWQVTSAGASMIRPLAADFREDQAITNVPDQFMFGPSLMACPVIKPRSGSRIVELPSGVRWIDFWTGAPVPTGATVEAASPLATMPIFVRAGGIVPLGPDVQNAQEKCDPVELRVYPGADGSFTLYDDQGDGYAYEKGAYATIPLKWDDAKRTLTIGKRSGSYPGMPKERTFLVVLVGFGHGAGIVPTEKPETSVTYRGSAVSVRLP